MQVTFVAPVRLLLWRPIARTEVHQTVDISDASSVRVSFSLMKSVSRVLLRCRSAGKDTVLAAVVPHRGGRSRNKQLSAGQAAVQPGASCSSTHFPLCADIGGRLWVAPLESILRQLFLFC